MLQFLKRFLDFNEKQIQRYRIIVDKINALEDKARNLKDEEFAEQTQEIKDRIGGDPTKLEAELPWAYALVREAARRTLGMRHFDVQLIAGIALHDGKIIEQKTGEGKTLTATSALYLNALTGKGAHLVTVNDYLARRDAGWMGAIFAFLGLTTSAMISEKSYLYDPDFNEGGNDWRLAHLREITRKQAYQADITYGINSEFGFDYLRDNMATQSEQVVQRGFYFAVVDEADSVLIDEARTPHIISAPVEQDTSKYYEYARIVKRLDPATDFVIDEKLRTAHLSDDGLSKIEKALGVDNMYEKDYDTIFHIEAALKAEALFKNDKEYIVKDGEVIIVDEFTGRLLQGRRFSEGLHQAIEAKEGVEIKQESRTLATVSLQNYFRMYDKLAGMTGTAATEAEEFNKIYKTDVVAIPTHRNVQRLDQADVIYKTVKAKFDAVVNDVAEQHKKGRPVLIGTTSIDKNEYLASQLKKRGVPFELLNAKNHEREAQIIARAGEKGAVTVATNMAGRGVDIILGGMQPVETEMEEQLFEKANAEWQKKHDEVVELGGLYVIGTERHESRRIDNQLRGRSGRQGDPGESKFFVSLEDDLMRIFGGEQISKMMTFFNLPEDQPLSHSMVTRAIEQAQVKVEGFNFDIRKHLVEYDDVLNRQRDIIYTWRRKFMNLPDSDPDAFDQEVTNVFTEVMTQTALNYHAIKESMTDEEREVTRKEIATMFPGELDELSDVMKETAQEALNDYLMEQVDAVYTQKEELMGEEFWRQIVRGLFLSTVDQYWTQHLTAIDDLREGINLRGYAQLDPLVEYKREAFRLFEELLGNINQEFTRRVLHIELQNHARAEELPTTASIEESSEEPSRTEPKAQAKTKKSTASPIKTEQPRMVYKAASAADPFQQVRSGGTADSSENSEVELVHQKKPGRNDPCWCGSGKKYKKCHYPN